MAVQATYPISLTSIVNEFNPTFTPRGVIIANYSADNLAFDNTVDPILLIPPGVRAPIVIGHYVSTLRVRSASNTEGSASITIMDSQPDMTGAPALQQLPGTITAVIPTTSPVTTIPDPTGLQKTSDATTQQLITALNTLITTLNTLTATTNTNTGGTATNTGKLLTAIGSTRVLLTSNNAPQVTAAMVAPVDRFTVQPVAVRRAGLLSIFTIGPGVNNNVCHQSVYVAGVPKLPWEFDEIVPPGFQIEVWFLGDGDFSVSY